MKLIYLKLAWKSDSFDVSFSIKIPFYFIESTFFASFFILGHEYATSMKQTLSQGKIMASVFWDKHGVLLVVTNNYYQTVRGNEL